VVETPLGCLVLKWVGATSNEGFKGRAVAVGTLVIICCFVFCADVASSARYGDVFFGYGFFSVSVSVTVYLNNNGTVPCSMHSVAS